MQTMYYTGFADEASPLIDIQIKATKELGWENIESRNIEGKNITDISDEKFEEVFGKLQDADVKINCFGSAVANWAKQPRSEEDFQLSIEELKRALPRMERLGCKMIRGMSFAVAKDEQPDSPELEKIIFNKVEYLAKMCEDAGVVYLHENCMNYGGMSYEHTLRLIENVKSPAFKLVFDTGNPVFTHRRIGKAPYALQNAYEFYANVKEFIHYVHIKDGIATWDKGQGERPEIKFTYAGEGAGFVRQIVQDLLKNGYDGGFSMEPHLAVVHHESDQQTTDEDIRYNNYIEYGKRFMQLVKEVSEQE
jgi:sugar phosphate isomerase/epimerase